MRNKNKICYEFDMEEQQRVKGKKKKKKKKEEKILVQGKVVFNQEIYFFVFYVFIEDFFWIEYWFRGQDVVVSEIGFLFLQFSFL